MKHLLITGIGGICGINFIRALRASPEPFFIAGTDFNPYYLELAQNVDVRIRTPRHSDNDFLPLIARACKEHEIQLIHPTPSAEARVLANMNGLRDSFPDMPKMFLPKDYKEINPNKLTMMGALKLHDVPVPEWRQVFSERDIEDAFDFIDGSPLWIRAYSGAGGRLSLKVNKPEEALHWVRLHIEQKRAALTEFLIHEYLPGRDLAFDSLWKNGKMLFSSCRERLEYPFKHISLSGITGTPSVARTIGEDKQVESVGIAAVKALSNNNPHGFYSVDLKEDADGKPKVTEVDGKWHTTAPLWGHAFARAYGNQNYNLAWNFVKSAFDEDATFEPYPADHYLIRQMDSGVVLKHGDKVWRIV